MSDRKIKNVSIFNDTMNFISENEGLQWMTRESIANQILYLETADIKIPKSTKHSGKTIISADRSFETAAKYARAGKKVCVLNFASATNPGGGVKHGSSAQEECLCRCSTLYPCLNTAKMWKRFYDPHRKAGNPLYNADCLYTPGVIVFKSDSSFPERMKERDWYQVDVLTCAAPNLRSIPSNFMNPHAGDKPADIDEKDLYQLYLKRIERIFRAAAANKVEVLILGAFGCGAFCNPPELVARAFRTVQKKYDSYFDVIEYAIFCGNHETRNYKAFCKAFGWTDKYQMIQDKISGCVFSGALGDALGYVVEFEWYSSIKNKYGKNGIQDLLRTGEEAIISDDTQMTLFTMEGMSVGTDDKVERKIYLSYLKWAKTQELNVKLPCSWPSRLAMVPKMNCRRAPGNTCMNALTSGKMGTIQKPINNSKGCGGVMRTAPLGFTEAYGSPLLNGAKAAAITHGHPLGWIPAGMLSDIVFKCIYGEKKPLKLIIEESLADTKAQFERFREVIYFEQLIKKAIALSEMDYEDDAAIIEKELGGGWVGEEALAIAVYCCLKYPYSIKKALIAAVNHSGDSDSTGAVAGNIIGAYLGMSAVPKDWMDRLELVDVMQEQIGDIMSMIRDR